MGRHDDGQWTGRVDGLDAQLGNATAAAIEKRLLMKLDETQTQAAKTLAEKYLDQYVRPFK